MLTKTGGYVIATLTAICGFVLPSHAALLAEKDVPAPLKPWIPWATVPEPHADCLVVDETLQCTWPGSVRLDLTNTGGTFELRVRADAHSEQPLVGDQSVWPQEVRIDGRPAAVLFRDGLPSVHLEAGIHTITGKLFWPSLPEGLRIPRAAAVLSLAIDGKIVGFPKRGAEGIVWLQNENASEGAQGDRLDLTVTRKITDGVPMTIETRLDIRASGRSREVELPAPLLSQTQILDIESPLPARIGKEKNLHLQLRAGTHTVIIRAHTGAAIPDTFTLSERPEPWPKTETWVWQSDEELRQVTVSGAPGVDPSRTTLPKEWKTLPAFIVSPGSALTLETTRRAEPFPPPDQLDLHRRLWLDMDGIGYTVRDTLSGTLNQTWRLDLASPGKLGHVAVAGSDRLITKSPKEKQETRGVELRKGSLDMTAESRYEDARRIVPAVGWNRDVQNLSATLNLPPGWQLLSAVGVDNISGTWWDDWNLFTFFFVLVVSLAIAKLTRIWIGVVALVALVLCHQQEDAPYFVWVSLLLSLGLLRVLPTGRLLTATKLWWWASVIWLAAVLVPFSVTQVRTGLFPQIEQEYSPGIVTYAMTEKAEALPPEPSGGSEDDALGDFNILEEGAVRKEQRVARRLDERSLGSLEQALYGSSRSDSKAISTKQLQALGQDPKAVVQTGPGVPDWSWKSWQMSWSGPVDANHEITLYLVSPTMNLVISILRVLLLVLVSFFLVRHALRAMKPRPNDKDDREKTSKPPFATMSTAGILMPLLLLAPEMSSASDFPPQELLSQLKERLTQPRTCEDDCLSVSRMVITARGDRLALECEVHAGSFSSFRLPGPIKNWAPETISIDGKETTTDMALREDDFIHVRIPPGQHLVRVEGRVPPTDAVTLELGDKPHRVEIDAPGYTVDGVRDDQTAQSSILLARIQSTAGPAEGDGSAAFEESSYPPWLRITRTFAVGLPWTAHTVVERVGPAGSAVLVRVPLVAGESVVDADVRVEGAQAVVSLGRNDTLVEWVSTLKETPKLRLQAPKDKPWSERWVFECSPMWQCDFEGLVPTHRKTNGVFRPVFDPWPGETMTASFFRPEGAPGQSITIDDADLEIEPGARLVKATLTLVVRSSRGGEQTITLPVNATIQELTVDGSQRPYRQKEREVQVTLEPGTQRIEVVWQQTGGIETRYQTPLVSVGRAAANVTVSVALPSNRWLIWTGGPSWGPAILFWGYLLTVLLAGLVLGSVPFSPLKRGQWMLLALGLTQVPPAAAIAVVLWFLVLARRAESPPRHFLVHNGLQVILVIWAVVAMVILVISVYQGLAVQPDMQVEGAGSTNTHLSWYIDRSDGTLPRPWIVSIPLFYWKLIMLAWSLWLAWSVLKWAPWTWRSISKETLWRPVPARPKRGSHRDRSKRPETTGDDPA